MVVNIVVGNNNTGCASTTIVVVMTVDTTLFPILSSSGLLRFLFLQKDLARLDCQFDKLNTKRTTAFWIETPSKTCRHSVAAVTTACCFVYFGLLLTIIILVNHAIVVVVVLSLLHVVNPWYNLVISTAGMSRIMTSGTDRRGQRVYSVNLCNVVVSIGVVGVVHDVLTKNGLMLLLLEHKMVLINLDGSRKDKSIHTWIDTNCMLLSWNTLPIHTPLRSSVVTKKQ